MLSFAINTNSVEESNLFLRKLWCELNEICENAWEVYPSNQQQHITIGRSNIGEISFDYKRKGCIKNLYIDMEHEEDTEKINLAVQRALSGKFKTFSVQIKLVPKHKTSLIAPISKDNISFSVNSNYNTLTLNILAYSLLDVKKILELKFWTLQALLYEYTLGYFAIDSAKICHSKFYSKETKQISYDYGWTDFCDRPLNNCGNIIVPEECLWLISNLFSDKINDSDILLYNSARILLTAHQIKSGMEYLIVPGIIDVINSTAISSIEPLAYFINQQEGQCDKCGNKIFSVVSKIKELLTKYFSQSFATYYCKIYYSDRSKLFHQGYTKTNHTKSDISYPLLDPHNPSKILMPSFPVDSSLFDCSSYIFRNIIHEYYIGSLVIKDKNGKELKLEKLAN